MRGLAIGATLPLLLCASVAVAQVPRGRRSAPAAPTHLVAVEAECRAGKAVFTLLPGARIRARGKLGKRPVAVELVGPVAASCRVPAAALGLRVAADTPIRQGAVVVGAANEGALVRLVPGARAPRGQVVVEAVGDATARFAVPRQALTAEPREFVYRQPAVSHWVTPKADVRVFARKTSVNTNAPAVGTIAGGVEVLLLEQDGGFARVRSYGPVEIEGWSTNQAFLDKRTPAVEPRLLSPTHEVLAGAVLVDASGDKLAELAGGALVEVTGSAGARARVTTTGRVVVSGFVDGRDLRELADAQVLPTP